MDKLSILLIDDDQVDRKTYRKFLSENDADLQVTILEADNANAGIELWKANSVDCVLLDYNLPGVNGLEVLTVLKKDNDSIPIIMLTGCGKEQIAVQAMKLGAIDYLVKDEINSHILSITITNAINKLKLIKKQQDFELLEQQKKIIEEQNRLKSEFLTNISHELKSPLDPIIGFTQLLHDEMLGTLDPKQKKSVRTSINECNSTFRNNK